MKKILLLLLITSLACTATQAQIRRNSDSSQNVATNSDKKSQKLAMMKDLNLSRQQKGALKDFRKDQKQKKDEIMNDQLLTDVQKQEKMKELHKEQKDKLNSILTPEQMQQLKQERMNNKAQNKSLQQTDSTGKME